MGRAEFRHASPGYKFEPQPQIHRAMSAPSRSVTRMCGRSRYPDRRGVSYTPMTGTEVKQQRSILAIRDGSPPSRQGTPFGWGSDPPATGWLPSRVALKTSLSLDHGIDHHTVRIHDESHGVRLIQQGLAIEHLIGTHKALRHEGKE